MQVKNLATGEIDALRYGAAADAVNAGTHEYISENGKPAAGAAPVAGKPVDLNSMTKDDLLAEAQRRGVEVKAGDTKVEIIKALEAK
ncbi:hypothetical protein [Terrihabitans rhizophilus]|uniref:Rho termination factor N-terminal domain-containing protein n=1 Tax=Terrihabitans rhizophilus TaxID=3092662 RepID=A0ABU4RQE2_9HYPH|nr:hypothetical protein [Terrihabitans sp. PJ23]MDX6806319.1 hypothetical protein [Terrihabitans sp. PJ23]